MSVSNAIEKFQYGRLTPKGLDWCIRRYCGGESL